MFDLESHFPNREVPQGLTLELDGLHADVKLRAGESHVRMTVGPDPSEALDDLTIEYGAATKTLSLRQPPLHFTSGGGISISSSSVRIGSFTRTVATAGRIVVNGVDLTDVVRERQGGGSADRAAVEIEVPKGTHLTAAHVAGRIQADGLDGQLNLNADMEFPVSVTGVRENAILTLTGAADVSLDDVTGTLRATTVGSGDLTLRNVDLESASLIATGSGNREIRGHIANMVLTTSGSGDTLLVGQLGSLGGRTIGAGDVSIEGGLGDGISPRSLVSLGSGRVTIRRTGPYARPAGRATR